MKKNFIANELKLSYHKNAKLSIDDFKCINNSNLLQFRIQLFLSTNFGGVFQVKTK